MNFDETSNAIAKRQYWQEDEKSSFEMFERVARYVSQADEDPESAKNSTYRIMSQGRFIPGGRILAGAGSNHGNLLNCFVQSGDGPEGTDDWVMSLAMKLALVTKVGGGNGVNLDPLPPKSKDFDPLGVGGLIITCDELHPDYDDVRNGRYFDMTHGKKLTFGYEAATFIPKNYAPKEFVIRVPDSTEGIWDAATMMVHALLAGEIVTVDVSELRPEGDEVRGSGGTSSGPSSFAVEVFENFAKWANLGGAQYAGPVATLRYVFAPTLRVIRQGGTRRGAGMATLSATHADLDDFITCKDLEREQTEGSIGTFNISVLATDEFMQEGNGRLEAVARHAHATGEPGLIFIDQINHNNALYEVDGPIMATNPCGEVGLYPGEPCDLGAMNVAAYVKGGAFNSVEFVQDAKIAFRFLDNVLTMEEIDIPEISAAIEDKRRIGLGVLGLADAMIRMGISYDTHAGERFAQYVATLLRNAALEESERLGIHRGVPTGVNRAGLSRRNIAGLTVAPTGTTAMVLGVTSGIEPVYSAITYRRVGDEYIEILHPLLKEILGELEPRQHFFRTNDFGEKVWDFEALKTQLSAVDGSVQDLPNGWVEFDSRLAAFLTAHEIRPEWHVRIQAAVQRAFDDGDDRFANSISKTINMPNRASVEDVLDAYRLGWSLGLKGMTVYRDGSRDFQVLNTQRQEDDGTTEDPYCNLDGSCDT